MCLYQVFYIDFGNSEVVPADSLRYRVALADIPAQCLQCEINGMKPVSAYSHVDLYNPLLWPEQIGVMADGIISVWSSNIPAADPQLFPIFFLFYPQVP